MTELELEPKSGKVQRRLFICLRLLSKDQDGRGFFWLPSSIPLQVLGISMTKAPLAGEFCACYSFLLCLSVGSHWSSGHKPPTAWGGTAWNQA